MIDGFNEGQEITLVTEANDDPYIDALKFSGMKVVMRKENDDVVLEGKTYSVGFNASVNGPNRAEGSKTFKYSNVDTFAREFDSLIDELFNKDAQADPQTPGDKPVDRELWKSRIDKGREFGKLVF